jgi:hypothetical protein
MVMFMARIFPDLRTNAQKARRAWRYILTFAPAIRRAANPRGFAMNQQESEALAQFCADQFFAFDARAWARRSQYDHHASTVAAMYLSLTTWYGHELELERIAAGSQALDVTGQASRRASPATEFDPAGFSAMVRAEIARRRIGPAMAAAPRESQQGRGAPA